MIALAPPCWVNAQTVATTNATPEIRTPKPPPTPRINGPGIFGVRPGHPLLYHIPATGDRPMTFSADALPAGLKLDEKTGLITGALPKAGEHVVTLRAKNAKGSAEKKFRIVVGEEIALTPPMGWNSWNHYASRITADIVLANAKAMAESGLIDHGWTYMNIDDTWQGKRGGRFNAIQGNEKFPDMTALCDAVHALGLKVGIYSTPWTTSYATHIGGSAENPEGTWEKPAGPKTVNKKILPWAIGKYSFATNDAAQWAAWGIDYLKYDWNPIEAPETKEMADALRHSGRDIIYSLSNNLNPTNAPSVTPLADCWRTSGDIKANWNSMSSKGFGEDKWLPFNRPGHWNDPDMLEVGNGGMNALEYRTHMSLWAILAAPLLAGNDLTKMSPETLSILANKGVIAIDQDPLGRQGDRLRQEGPLEVWTRPLAGGGKAVGLFNLSDLPANMEVSAAELGLKGSVPMRDVWADKDLGRQAAYHAVVPAHGVVLLRLGAPGG
jgi:alpha-galactosidase